MELLERLGCTVEFREEQTCCGQMHLNSGYRDEGLALVERFRGVFAGADAIVAPSASCAAHVRAAAPELPVYELTEYLTDVLGVVDVGARFPHRVCYHPTCHSLRELHVGDRPAAAARLGRRPGGRRRSPMPTSAAGSAARSRSRTPTSRRR